MGWGSTSSFLRSSVEVSADFYSLVWTGWKENIEGNNSCAWWEECLLYLSMEPCIQYTSGNQDIASRNASWGLQKKKKKQIIECKQKENLYNRFVVDFQYFARRGFNWPYACWNGQVAQIVHRKGKKAADHSSTTNNFMGRVQWWRCFRLGHNGTHFLMDW